MSTLERAIQIAASAHQGQLDKAGAPYILHSLRVMLRLEDTRDRIVAVLHDVLEDTSITRDALKAEGFDDAVLEALEHLTKRPGEDYLTFIERARGNPISRRVKLADLEDNSDLSRIETPTEADRARVEKYAAAIRRLQELP